MTPGSPWMRCDWNADHAHPQYVAGNGDAIKAVHPWTPPSRDQVKNGMAGGRVIRRPLLRLLNLLVERLLADGAHDVYGNSFEPCSERHPKHFLLCGNWDYARKNWLYPAGHPGEHAVVGRAPRADGLGYYDCRARWTA